MVLAYPNHIVYLYDWGVTQLAPNYHSKWFEYRSNHDYLIRLCCNSLTLAWLVTMCGVDTGSALINIENPKMAEAVEPIKIPILA